MMAEHQPFQDEYFQDIQAGGFNNMQEIERRRNIFKGMP